MIAFMTSLLLFSSEALGAPGNCPDDILGYWKLDENISGTYVDEIGTNTGVCSGGCPGSITGTIGRAKFFDGVTDSIRINANTSLDWSASQSFTIELWMRRNPGIAGLEVLTGRSEASGLNWYVGINSSGNAQALLKASDGSGPGILTGTKTLISSGSDPTWHHVALVRDASASQTTLYVDGQALASQTFSYSAGFSSATAPMTMGALDGDNYLDGGLDEVAIYSRALSEYEIRGHYYISLGYCSRYDAPLTIMPLGDSITKGTWTNGQPPEDQRVGYRLDLWDLLVSNLYVFNFIGSENNGSAIDLMDDNHAGFNGITDDQIFTLLATGWNEAANPDERITNGPYLEYYPADIILLHIGTNAPDTSPTAVSNSLDEIDAFSKNSTVLVARIIERLDSTVIPNYNIAIQNMVTSRIAQGDKIIMVDMEDGAGINYTIDSNAPYTGGDMFDVIHPNPSGYNKMAGKWFETLEGILPQSDIPLITSSAGTETLVGEPYVYNVTATGPPSPTFSLINNPPAGMTIDSVSGQVQWQPDATGDFDVTIQATNWIGEDTQSFTLSVVDSISGGGGGGGGGGCFINTLF
jgi:lysophospholipase L1-like esterase